MLHNSSNTRASLKGLLRCQTEIKNSIDYSMFFKKGFSHCKNLQVEFLETNSFRNSQGRQKMQQRLIKLLKKAKPVKSLDLHKCIVQYESIPDSTIVEIAKKTSRVQVLSIPDYAVSQAVVKKYALWLKNARRLTKFNFIAPVSVDLPQLKDSEETVAKFLHEIRRDRIKSINITHKVSNTEKLENSLLAFQRYPSTLQSLNFDCRNYSDEWELSKQSVLSLSHMHDLTSLALAFRNQTDILDPMISSLDNISQLRHLKIEFFDALNQSDQVPFEKLLGARNLNSLELKFDVWPQGLENFLQKVEEFPLKKLCLDTTITDGNHQLQAIQRLLSQLENLEALKLKISKDSLEFHDKEQIRDIMEQIVSMRLLKNLNIEFIVPGGANDSEKLDESIIPSLKMIFLKATKLQKFSIHCNQIQNIRQAFLSLLASLARGRIASNLKKLRVDLGKFMPEESELRQIANFTERFLNIETLKLMSICGLMSQSMQGFLETVQNLQYLKKFEISELKGSLNKQIFVLAIEKLLSKRGLEKFDCCLAWDTKEVGARRTKGCQIDLKKVLEKNPSLQNYPQSSIIFSYYNDDTAWKWS